MISEALNQSLPDLSRPSFMDRMSGMRREGRRPAAAMDRMSCMRREGRRPVAAMDRMSCMRREGTPAWMQVVDGVGNRPSRTPVAAMDRMCCMRRDAYRDVGGRPRLERAVEGRRPAAARRKPESDHVVIPAQAGIQWFVLSIPACRQAGMTTERGYPAKPAIDSRPRCSPPRFQLSLE